MDPHRLSEAIVALAGLMARLRGPGGCPWDAEQTDATVRMYLIEEAYEVLDAVERGSPRQVCQELGDLLFQVLFLARLAEEREEFDLADVMEGIREKMVRRHPHVFGDEQVSGAEDVARNWTRIKQAEKKDPGGNRSLLESVPGQLPALMKTHRLCERAAGAGLYRTEPDGIREETRRRAERLEKALDQEDETEMGEAIGALLFSLADLARQRGMNAEDLLRRANRRFLEGLRP